MAGTYICTASAVNPYTTSLSPYVCTGMISATQFGQILARSEASQELLNMAVQQSCVIAIDIAGDTAKIIALKATEQKNEIKRNVTEIKRTFSALNSAEGISWLMRYLSQ